MAETLSIYSRDFQDTFKDVEKLIDEGKIKSKSDLSSFLDKKEISLTSFLEANNKYSDAIDKGVTDFSPGFFGTRILGRALGDAGRGIGSFAEMVLPEEISTGLSYAAEQAGEYVAPSIAESASYFFDPYHGEGALATGEEVVGVIGSYIIPFTGITKGAKATMGATKAFSPGVRSLATKTSRKLGRKGRALAAAGGYGTAFAGAATIVEKPEENVVNILTEAFPESTQFLQRLSVDPNDTEAEQYLQSAINNLGFGLLFAPLSLAAVYKAPILKATRLEKPVKTVSQATGKAATLTGTALKSLPGVQQAANLSSRIMPYVTSRVGTDNRMLALELERKNAEPAALARAEGRINQLKAAVNSEYAGASDKELATVTKRLQGVLDGKAATGLRPQTKELITGLKTELKGLSANLTQGTKGTLKTTISNNLDLYMTKAYRLFEDPAYAKQIRSKYKKYNETGLDENGIFTSAKRAIKKFNKDLTNDEIDLLLGRVVRADKDTGLANIFDSFAGYNNKTGRTKSGHARKDIPKQVKELLGEIDDPYANFAKTFSNLSVLNAEQTFLKEVRQHLLDSGVGGTAVDKATGRVNALKNVSEDRLAKIWGYGVSKDGRGPNTAFLDEVDGVSPQAASEIRGRIKNQFNAKVLNPLEDLYVDENYLNMLRDGLEVATPTNWFSRAFMKSKALTQTTKTAYSTQTHGRNVMGNMIMLVANGMASPSKLNQAAKDVGKKLLDKSTKESGERYGRYLELNIANSGLAINLIRQNYKAFADNPEAWTNGVLTRKFKGANKKVLDTYQAEDDLFKIIHFEKTLDVIKKSGATVKKGDPVDAQFIGKKYNELPLRQQEELAAQRTRDLMPNYDLVPKFVKKMRGLPVGDFISFPAEMSRISKNLVKYTMDDLKSGDAVLQTAAAKRAAGTTAAAIVPSSLMAYSMAANGITSEQEEAINNSVVPSWEFNQDRIYFSPLEKDARGHITADYVNLGPIDPFSFIKQAAKGIHTGVFSGEEMSSADYSKMAMATLENSVGSFLMPSMITEAALKLMDTGRLDTEATMTGKIQKAIEPLIDVVTPGTVNYFVKRNEFEKSREKFGEGMERKKGGYAFSEGEVWWPAAIGLSSKKLDVTASIPFAISPVIGDINLSNRAMTQYLSDPNLVDEQENIIKRYKNSQMLALDGQQQLQSLIEDYQAILGEDFEAEFGFGLSRDNTREITADEELYIREAMRNQFVPYTYKRQDVVSNLNRTDIPWQAMVNIYNELLGMKLKEIELIEEDE